MTIKSHKTLTIGTFDGVHLGHQKIITKIIDTAQLNGTESAVLTFFPHPRMVLQNDDSIKLLNTIDERIALLKENGIASIIVKSFTRDFASLSAKDYVKNILIDELNAKHVIIGYDHRFGKNRSAGFEELDNYSKHFGFSLEEISAKDIDQVTISSTKIRNALNEGDVTLANSYLGYHYFLTGTVVKGKSLGRTLGFPTANIHIEESYKLIPKDGVFVISSNINEQIYFGMMNIGSNPTIKDKPRSIEVHFFDFDTDIYGKTLKIEILSRLRNEQRFESIEKLKEQLTTDKQQTLEYLQSKS